MSVLASLFLVLLNPSNMLFTSSLILGTFITITSSSWMIMWMGLEMNLLSFIPIMNQNKSTFESESAMKYFLVQAMASLLMIMAILMTGMTEEMTNNSTLLMSSAVFLKMGAAPLHTWFPSVIQGLTWKNALLLMTWQKIAPMAVLSYLSITSMMMNTVSIISVIVGSMGGLNQTSIRKMMAYSSISHIGWMIMSMMMSNTYWSIYFMIYTLLNVASLAIMMKLSILHLPQMYNMTMPVMSKLALMTSILSLGGLPPFLGFLPKWVIIQNMMDVKNYTMITIMVMSTLITLYFYLRITYSAFMFNSETTYWKMSSKYTVIVAMSISISLLGIPAITMLNLT